jgi:hypothetical protein
MMPRALTACIAIFASLVAAAAGEAPKADTPPPPAPVVAIFDFTSPGDGAAGRQFTENLRIRAKRLGLVIVEPLSMKEAMAGATMPTLKTPAADMAAILKDRLDTQFGLWGEVTVSGNVTTIEVRGLNIEKGAKDLTISRSWRAEDKQFVNPAQDEILTELTGIKKKKVPEATPEEDAKVPTVGPELLKNGDFEKGDKTPDAWQKIDGLTTFYVSEGMGGGKCLKVNTDVYHDEWVAWQKKIKEGAVATDAPPPTPTKGAKYDTVAGIYGVAFFSDPIPVTPGKAYKVNLNYRGQSADIFFPKVFIRGYADVGGEKRAVYDAYLSLRSKSQGKDWEWNVRIVEIPKDTKAPVEYVKIMLYAYWPPGTYYFDNVSFKEVAPGATIPGK